MFYEIQGFLFIHYFPVDHQFIPHPINGIRHISNSETCSQVHVFRISEQGCFSILHLLGNNIMKRSPKALKFVMDLYKAY